MALTTIKTGAIADDAVTTDKLANAINTERTANAAKTTNATHTGEVTGSGALTITADAVTGAKIADDAIDSEHYADGSIDTAHIADNQITLAKMAGGTDGQIITYDASGDPVAVGPGTDGQVLTSTGAGSPPAFEDVPASGKAHNLIINGAMTVHQRGTSSTSSGYHTVDRFQVAYTGTDEAPTQAQVDVASGTTPYTLGFRKALKITNGNQTSGAGSGDTIQIVYKVEAQDLTGSGWNYQSASSYITLSFWVKSSVAQEFHGFLLSSDSTRQLYSFSTGSLSADTWTKVTKTIPGNSNINMTHGNGEGLNLRITQFAGTDKTGTITQNQWGAFLSSVRYPNNTSTWYTTNDATFELTGVQLEVGNSASDFAFKSFAEDVALCQRYCYIYSFSEHNSSGDIEINFIPVDMRALPTVTRNGNVMFGGESSTAVTAIYNSLGYSIPDQAGSNLVLRCINSSDANCGGNYTLSAEL